MTPALVVLNPAAGGGRAESAWTKVEPAVARHFAHEVVRIDPEQHWVDVLQAAVTDGIRVFIAAGGDGTVGLLINALMRVKGSLLLPDLTLGAVGLGSSNDFHKPVARTVAGIPIKQELAAGAFRDVCLARYQAPDGSQHHSYFLVSASLGVTAEANALFNRGDRLLRGLKRHWTSGGILYAALKSIATYRNFEVSLWSSPNGRQVPLKTKLTNLSLLKTPHLSGGLRFDTPAAADDGLLAVNLCQQMSRPQTLGVLVDLSRGRFVGRPGRLHWQTPWLVIETARPAALELDGEVVRIRRVEFEVLPERIRVCA